MNKKKLISEQELFEFYISDAVGKSISGWEFPYNKERYEMAPLSWSYKSKILPFVRRSESLLDMETGGGEFLSELAPLPKHCCATEGYVPIISVAKKILEPLGVKVFSYEKNGELPFSNDEFELIINRHESYDPEEVYRILQTDGYFITQQVGGKNESQLRKIFLGQEKSEWDHWNLSYAIKELEDADFTIIESKESYPLTRIFDIGALVYYLTNIPWEVPGFEVEKYKDKLLTIHEIIMNQGFFDVYSHRFFILAKKE
ncbi:MAG: class I SAM-dependent methyltransferase [Candidatus Heimdallarchaeaceae archaeon]